MQRARKTPKIEYEKTILEGVEIKHCSNTHQSYKHHVHRELSLGYIVRGRSTVQFGGRDYRYMMGEGIVIPPMLSHMCSPDDPSDWGVVMLYIDLSYYRDSLQFTQAAKITPENLAALMDFIKSLEAGDDIQKLDECLAGLLADVEQETQPKMHGAADFSHEIRQVYDFINEHYAQNITLAQLEDISGMNKFALIRGFKIAYNTTPAAFALQVKVTRAKGMISHGVDVMDVCMETGFYDQAHFIREFKKMTGITPSTYAKSVGK